LLRSAVEHHRRTPTNHIVQNKVANLRVGELIEHYFNSQLSENTLLYIGGA